VWCHDCAGGSISKVGWGHKNKAQHNVVSLKDAGKVDDAIREFLFVSRGGRAAQMALAEEKQRAEAGQTRASAGAPEVYKLDFGIYKGRTIASMFGDGQQKAKDYIPWCFASANMDMLAGSFAGLRLALQREGEWERTVKRAQEMRPGLQRRALEHKAEMDSRIAAGETVHPVEVKMRKLQAEKVRRDQQRDQDDGVPRLTPSDALVEYRPSTRVHRSTATVANKHCRFCGQVGHRQDGCAKAREQLALQQQGDLDAPRVADLDGLDKKLAQVVAHLKYTWLEQRTRDYDARRPRAQESQCVSGHQLCRMTAWDMCQFSLQCDFLSDLEEPRECTNPKCADYAEKWGTGWSKCGPNTLGPLRARTDVFEVSQGSAWRRCQRCRRVHSVHHDNPMYSMRDRLDEATYAWWMFINGAGLTLTALHMGRKEDLVRRYYHHAATICAHDAENRQAHIRFGQRHPYTTIIEPDETRIGKFKVTIEGVQYHYHLVLLGVEARGDPASLWLLLVVAVFLWGLRHGVLLRWDFIEGGWI